MNAKTLTGPEMFKKKTTEPKSHKGTKKPFKTL